MLKIYMSVENIVIFQYIYIAWYAIASVLQEASHRV